ncbi:MAG: glycoside hydrolase family 3 N-terminal domain-containing protein [Acidimicrobiales bacterium]
MSSEGNGGRVSVGQRIEDLVHDMSLDEKLAQLGGVWSTDLIATHDTEPGGSGFSAVKAATAMPHGAGQITRIAATTGLRPDGLAMLANDIQRWLVTETRLGIPAIIHEEAVAGFCARDAVQFPQAIGLASTFDRSLLRDVGEHVRREMLAVGARQALSPVLDIARDPRWGRVEETYGEDPVLAGELGTAYVQGLQNVTQTDNGPVAGLRQGVIATGKHFIGYGASDGGLNHGPVQIGSRELRDVFAEPFAAAIRDGRLASVMSSYNSVDGLPGSGSRVLLTELLRDDLGFVGTVVADYFAVDLLRTHHRVAPTRSVAAAKALLAGLDVELPALDDFALLPALIDAEIVPMSVVDLAVRRVLRHKFELGLFDNPYVDDGTAHTAFGTATGRFLARRAAAESLILLDNDGTIPLDRRSLQRIAVIGPAADDPRLLEGDYHYPAHLEILMGGPTVPGLPKPDSTTASAFGPTQGSIEPGPWFPDIVTPLAGLRAALLGADVQLLHERGCDVTGDDRSGFDAAVAAASGADVAVVCIGGRSGLTPDATVGEARDAMHLGLTGVQLELLEAVAATGTPTVAVVISGRVHTLAEVEAAAGATLLAWVPGIEGGTAIAEVLLGQVAPSGRLPVSLPRSVGQVPVHYNHRAGGGTSQFWGDYTDGPTSPLHPFGYGLSTTTFDYSEADVEGGTTTEPTVIGVTVTNSGGLSADEVVQCYIGDQMASVARPVRQLVGFARVALVAGASKRVTFTIHPSRLAFHDDDFHFVCEPGAFRVEIGGWAGHPAITETFDLEGDIADHRQRDVVATVVTVEPIAPMASGSRE